jgi:quinol monooxygenase YgiN
MVKVGLFVRLHAKPGKEDELASLLSGGLSIVQEERETPLWFAVRFDSSTFAIFDAFDDDAGRKAHLGGRLAAALMAKAPELLAKPPVIEQVDVMASKVQP